MARINCSPYKRILFTQGDAVRLVTMPSPEPSDIDGMALRLALIGECFIRAGWRPRVKIKAISQKVA
jgi:hypothetical protein